MLSNVITSYIRVGVALLVGAAVTWTASTFHVIVNPGSEAALVTLTTACVTAGYYALVRLLEHAWPPAGVLLGVPARPDYAKVLADGAYLVSTLHVPSGPDPLARDGRDPNTPGRHRPKAAADPQPTPAAEPVGVPAAELNGAPAPAASES